MERLEIEEVSNLLVRQNVGMEWDRVCSMGKDTPSKWSLPYTVRDLLGGERHNRARNQSDRGNATEEHGADSAHNVP